MWPSSSTRPVSTDRLPGTPSSATPDDTSAVLPCPNHIPMTMAHPRLMSWPTRPGRSLMTGNDVSPISTPAGIGDEALLRRGCIGVPLSRAQRRDIRPATICGDARMLFHRFVHWRGGEPHSGFVPATRPFHEVVHRVPRQLSLIGSPRHSFARAAIATEPDPPDPACAAPPVCHNWPGSWCTPGCTGARVCRSRSPRRTRRVESFPLHAGDLIHLP